jgi:hypothetical protein
MKCHKEGSFKKNQYNEAEYDCDEIKFNINLGRVKEKSLRDLIPSCIVDHPLSLHHESSIFIICFISGVNDASEANHLTIIIL